MFNTLGAKLSRSTDEEQLPDGRVRRTNACNFCREKKIKCNGERPCANCRDRGEKCVMLKRRRGRLKANDPRSNSITARLQRIEEVISLSESGRAPARRNELEDGDSHVSSDGAVSEQGPAKSSIGYYETASEVVHSNPPESLHTRPRDVPLEGRDVETTEQENSSIYSAEASNYDYQGPRTMLSICSPPGIRWVCDTLKNDSFKSSAVMCVEEITRRLKVDRALSAETPKALSMEDAWRYSNAYFNSAHGIEFGVVHRKWFEDRLQSDFNVATEETQATPDTDTAWYALKNAVYAVGCRIDISSKANFQDACRESWRLFENALSTHTRLLYQRTSLLGVQALIVMAYYTDALGSPTLQYMLCSSCRLLAFSKGLHKRPPSAWNLSTEEVLQRNWMFWAMYCLEKQISMRSGRPSLIEDDEIDVDIPDRTPSDTPGSLAYCTLAAKMARFSSLIWKRLSTPRASRQSLDIALQTTNELDRELSLLESQNSPILGSNIESHTLHQQYSMNSSQIISLRFAFYGLTFDLHTRLTYPWCSGVSALRSSGSNETQMLRSRTVLLDASWHTVLLTRYLNIDANTSLLSFTTPFHAAVNMFLDVLQHPESTEVKSNLALLDVSAGFFARLDFATDWGFSARFVREMARLARLHVESKAVSQSGVLPYTQDNEGVHSAADLSFDWNGLSIDNWSSDLPSVDDLDEWRRLLELGDDFEFGVWPT